MSTSIQQITDTSPLASIDEALGRIFSSYQEETKLQKARRIMGSRVDSMADADLEAAMTQIQHLIDCWLDQFEQQTFEGMTLMQMLGQG